MATYFKHRETGKKYVMYTTHDDYCDGGNTYGYVVDMSKYRGQSSDDYIVADIGDSGFYCRTVKK